MENTLQQIRRLDIHKALLESGGGETVRQIAKRVKLTHSYVWGVLQRLYANEEIDRVEVLIGDKACIVYYTRWTNEVYESEAYALISRMF